MSEKIGCLFGVLWLAAGLVALNAAMSGIELLMGWLPAWAAYLGAIFSAWIPFVGLPLVYYGAAYGWGWHWYSALALTLPQPIIAVILLPVVMLEKWWQGRRPRSPDARARSPDARARSPASAHPSEAALRAEADAEAEKWRLIELIGTTPEPDPPPAQRFQREAQPQESPGEARENEPRREARRPMSAKRAVRIAGGWVAGLAALMTVSFCSEAPKYRFERIAKSEAATVPGARQLNAIRVVDIASPVSWFWPPATILNFAVPDSLMDGRFYQFSAQYEEADTAVFLLDVDCEGRKAEWYDLDEPGTAFPARNLWGEPVVAPNGKTYRRSKTQMALPADWLRAFCHTDWTAERKAAGTIMFKNAPK
jgi:hypothetical protein